MFSEGIIFISMLFLLKVNETIGCNTCPTNFEIPFGNKYISCTSYGSNTEPLSLIFTNGGKTNISTPSIVNFSMGFSEHKRIVCFNGMDDVYSRIKQFRAVMKDQRCDVLGGRSFGARAAIMTAKEKLNVNALVLVSFPLKNKNNDTEKILLDIDEGVDVIFVTGDRDVLCNLDDLREVMTRMKVKPWLLTVRNASHLLNMKPKKATEPVNRAIGKAVADWLDKRDEQLRNSEIHWDDKRNEVIVESWK